MAASKKEDPRAGPDQASDHVRKGSGFRRAVQTPNPDEFPPDEEPTAETDIAQLEHERALRQLSHHRSPPPTVDYANADDDSSGAWDAVTSKTDVDEVTTTAPQPPSSAKMMAAPVVAYRPPLAPPPARQEPPLSSTKLSAPPAYVPPPSSEHLRVLEKPLDVDVDSLAKAAQGHVLPRPPTPAAILATPPVPMPMHMLREVAALPPTPPRPPIETLPLDQSSPPPMVSEREMLSLPFLPPPVVRRAFIAALQAQAPPPRRSPWLTFFVVLVSVIAIAGIAYAVLTLTGHRPSLLIIH